MLSKAAPVEVLLLDVLAQLALEAGLIPNRKATQNLLAQIDRVAEGIAGGTPSSRRR